MSIFSNLTLIDFETTGLSPKNSRVIEFAAVKIVDGQIVDQMVQLINPEYPLPAKIKEITGITDADLAVVPTMQQFHKEMFDFLGDSILVAHNAQFDLWFLDAISEHFRGTNITNQFLDTNLMCVDAFPYKSAKLVDVCERLQIPLTGAHRALNDVLGMWGVLQKFAEEKGEDWIAQYINTLFYFRKWGRKEWYPEHAAVRAI